jgi:ATP-dependent RNA helicase RhlE
VKYLNEIEKLIKKEIEKETAVVPHSARSRASHDDHRERPARGERAERSHAPRGEHAERSYTRPAAPKKPSHDPWFDKPYEPSNTVAIPKQPEQHAIAKPKKQVAAIFQRKSSTEKA